MLPLATAVHPLTALGVVPDVIDDPAIDFSKLAQAHGVYAEPAITEPDKLGPALARALKVVKSGKPALIDVVSQPR